MHVAVLQFAAPGLDACSVRNALGSPTGKGEEKKVRVLLPEFHRAAGMGAILGAAGSSSGKR